MPALALTAGDPSGIGPDIAIQTWLMRRDENVPPFLLLADPDQIASRAKLLGVRIAIAGASLDDASDLFGDALPIAALDNPFVDTPGASSTGNAPGIIESIDRAVAMAIDCRADAVVTLPIAKKTLYDAGFPHPGHTEYLEPLARDAAPGDHRAVMMIAGPDLRTVPVTIHIPVAEVARQLTTKRIVEITQTTARDLTTRFGMDRPRLAIMGLNPHAGEGGSIGREDIEVILPAVEQLRHEGLAVSGPHPADTMFHPRARATYDVAICMYHDQALIPAKALAFDSAVNVTLGLPFIRTSPDHGTAFDIAGTGKARPDSLIAALKLARRLADTATARA